MNHSKTPAWEPHGKALLAYWKGNKEAKIGIKMDDGSITEMPIEIYFRTEKDFPEIEKIALDLCKGRVLDVGAGAGAHSLSLQQRGHEVTALDISKDGVDLMRLMGVQQTVEVDFLKYQPQCKFDTLLFLMNGIGLAGTLEGLKQYLTKAHKLTSDSGQLILDSSDLRNGEVDLDFSADYFGEINYQLLFEEMEGEPYKWLYVDQEMLTGIAKKCQWNCNIIYEQEDGGYLAQLTKIDG